MKRILKIMTAFIVPAAAGLFFLCSSPAGPSIAGGSGAGNPGGTVALSMLASLNQSMNKLSSDGSEDLTFSAGNQPIVAPDRMGLEITVTGISLSDVAVHFTLDTVEIPSHLLSSMQRRPQELSIDTHSIVLSGPYRFNALEGYVDSSIRALTLPVARYTGVNLHFDRDSISSEQFSSQLVLTGTFVLDGAVHNLAMDLTNRSWPSFQQNYRFSGGIFTLAPSETTNLQLQFNARRWFSQVDFAYLISKGSLFVNDTDGCVTISNRPYRSPSDDIGSVIFRDFFSSGRLVVF